LALALAALAGVLVASLVFGAMNQTETEAKLAAGARWS